MKKLVKLGCIIFLFILFGSSCSLLRPVPGVATKQQDARAKALFAKLKEFNQFVHSSRGVGKIKLQKDGRGLSARFVWAARRPDKLRVELLGPFGTSLGRLSTDGERIYFYSPEEKRIYQTPFSDRGLERLIYLPIRIRELIAVLTGGIPFRYNRNVWWGEAEKNGNIKLILTDTAFGGYQEILIGEDAARVLRTEIFQSRGQLSYGTEFDELRVFKPFEIPKRWFFYGEAQTTMSIAVDRSEVNVEIQDDLFQLAR